MAKDPAILFYTSDFLMGTIFFTDAECGMYIRLLCTQHQVGRMSLEQIKRVCPDITENVLSKFQIEDGMYYNERLELEHNKRQRFSESRKKNLSNAPNHKIHHMMNQVMNHMVNENENGISIKRESPERELKAVGIDGAFDVKEQTELNLTIPKISKETAQGDKKEPKSSKATAQLLRDSQWADFEVFKAHMVEKHKWTPETCKYWHTRILHWSNENDGRQIAKKKDWIRAFLNYEAEKPYRSNGRKDVVYDY